MSNNYATQGLTGKSHRKMVNTVATVLLAPLVHQDALSKSADMINDATKSGKQKGSVVILGDNTGKDKLAVAVGGKEQDAWKTIASASVTVVTPN